VKPRQDRIPDWAAVRQAMLADKKTLRKRPRFVLAERLGAAAIGCEVEDDVLAEAWHVCCQ
jgi:3-dehydroquinate synthetase